MILSAFFKFLMDISMNKIKYIFWTFLKEVVIILYYIYLINLNKIGYCSINDVDNFYNVIKFFSVKRKKFKKWN
jgi:hypothetical protein